MYGGPVVFAPRGLRYHWPANVNRSIACSILRTSHGLNPGITLANCCLNQETKIILSQNFMQMVCEKNTIKEKKIRKSFSFYLTSLGMCLFGMWSDSKIDVSSEPLAQRNKAWLGILNPGQIPSLASSTAKSRFLLAYASSCICLYVLSSCPLRGTHGGIPFCNLCIKAVAAAPSRTESQVKKALESLSRQ